ncbi:uncharacterized protein LOC124170193 isoform X2 [Ischnura elegans]|nr:uncharacterized protein LOC124170193 isoform X2 [Ischnura elegans]
MTDKVSIGNHTRCRLCRSSEEVYVDVFDPAGTNNLLVWKVIKEFSGLEVSPEDGLPPSICHQCMRTLVYFKKFKTKCIQSRIEFLKDLVYHGIVDRPDDDATLDSPMLIMDDFPFKLSDDVACRVKEEPLEDVVDMKPVVVDAVISDGEIPSKVNEDVPEPDSCARTSLTYPMAKQKGITTSQSRRSIPRVRRNPYSSVAEQDSLQAALNDSTGKDDVGENQRVRRSRAVNPCYVVSRNAGRRKSVSSGTSLEVPQSLRIKKEAFAREIVLKECCIMLKDVLKNRSESGVSGVAVTGGKRFGVVLGGEGHGSHFKRKRIKVEPEDDERSALSSRSAESPGSGQGGPSCDRMRIGRKTASGRLAVKQELRNEEGSSRKMAASNSFGGDNSIGVNPVDDGDVGDSGDVTASHSSNRKKRRSGGRCPDGGDVGFEEKWAQAWHGTTCRPKREDPTKKCSICDRTFPFPYLLKAHMKNHKRKCPFPCNLCAASFRVKGALAMHVSRLHKEES